MKKAIFSTCVCLSLMQVLADDPKPPASKQSPADALKKKIERPLVAGTVKEALAKIEAMGEVKIEPDWNVLRAAGVKEDAQVNVKAPQATVEQLLDMTLIEAAAKGHPLAWYAQGDRIRVTTQVRVLYRDYLPLSPLPLVSATPTTGKAETPAVEPKAEVRQLRFDDLPLEDAITFLRAVSGSNIFVNWKSLETIKVDRKTPITIRVSNISLSKAMDLVVEQLATGKDKLERVYWVEDERVITIATGAALNDTTKTKVFEVGDVLGVVPNFQGPRIDLKTGDSSTGSGANRGIVGGGGGGLFTTDDAAKKTDDQESITEQRKKLQEGLTGAIKDSIGEDMWQPTGKGAIRLFRDKLIITQTPLGFKLLEKSGSLR